MITDVTRFTSVSPLVDDLDDQVGPRRSQPSLVTGTATTSPRGHASRSRTDRNDRKRRVDMP
jgi:hypothetical protein